MIKLSLITVVLLAGTVSLCAQAYESTIQYEKKKQKAIAMEYAYPTDAVENAIHLKMDRLGYNIKEEKGLFNKDKGFFEVSDAIFSEIKPEKFDYIFKAERKSRRESDESVLYLIIRKEGANVLDNWNQDEINSVRAYLNSLVPEIEAANLEIKIKNQEEVVAKAEKKLSDLKDEQESLEKKLDQNRKDQESAQKDIEEQKKALGVLIGQRMNN